MFDCEQFLFTYIHWFSFSAVSGLLISPSKALFISAMILLLPFPLESSYNFYFSMKFPNCSCMLDTFSTIAFNTLIMVILNFLSVPTPRSYVSVEFLLCIYNWKYVCILCWYVSGQSWINLFKNETHVGFIVSIYHRLQIHPLLPCP